MSRKTELPRTGEPGRGRSPALSRRQALSAVAACSVLGARRAFAAAESTDALLAPEIAAIERRGELVFAMNSIDAYPFFYRRDNRLKGAEVRLAEDLAATLNVRATFNRSVGTFDGVVDLVAKGEADIGIGRLARTLLRARKALFTNPYMRLGHALLVNRIEMENATESGETLSAAIRHFRAKLGVIRDSAWVEFGRLYFPAAEIVAFPTWADVVDATKRGNVAAAYRDEYSVRSILRDDPKLGLTLRTVTFGDLESVNGMVVNRNSIVLLSYVNEYLSERGKLPTVDDILRSARSGS